MKKVFYNLLFILLVLSLSSCLKGGLEEFPVYEDADITSVSTVRYRYVSNQKIPSSDDYIVKEVDLTYTSDINIEAGTVKIYASTSDEFPAEELPDLSKSELVVAVSLSTAARLAPTGNSPKLGVPGDWSKANTYEVKSAAGNKKEWTIEVVSLEK